MADDAAHEVRWSARVRNGGPTEVFVSATGQLQLFSPVHVGMFLRRVPGGDFCGGRSDEIVAVCSRPLRPLVATGSPSHRQA